MTRQKGCPLLAFKLGATLAAALALAAGAPTAHAAATQKIVDQAGRTVTLPRHPTRIAVDYPALPATMYMLGAIDNVVATIPSGLTGMLTQLHPRAAKIPTPFGPTGANVEALLATNPQVIFVAEPLASTVLPTAKELGIPVVVFANFNGPRQLQEGVTLIAKILGTRKALDGAKAYAAYYNRIIRTVTAKTGKLAKAERVPLYYATGAPLTTEGSGSSVTVWMQEAGGRNVAAAVRPTGGFSFPTVSAEQLLRWNPRVIVASSGAVAGQVRGDSRLRSINAVRGKRVVTAPSGFFGWQVRGPESALMPLWAAKVLHPRLFANVKLRSTTADFYRRFFGARLSGAQIEAILRGAAK